MTAGVRGRLISTSFATDVLPSLPDAVSVPRAIASSLLSWSQRLEAALGGASSVRAVTDIGVMPLLAILDLRVERRTDTNDDCTLHIRAGRSQLVAYVVGWGEPLERLWRSSIVRAIATDARWCLCCNGQGLRIVDSQRAWSREYLEFDLALLGREPGTQFVFWCLLRADAVASDPPVLDRAVIMSSRHGLDVCRALGAGVLQALELLIGALATRKGRAPVRDLFEQSLTVLYRILFLLFAEARGLVPLWHPVYRDRYSVETIVEALLTGRKYRGLWQAIQAISRLAHAGCTAGELRVTAFNGRLFSPAHADAFERTPISDAVMGSAVVAVASTPIARRGARARIMYRDLDVEQLGAVYEHVLDYEPTPTRSLTRTRDVRKSSGTFYTPRLVTASLVRRTLQPLVADRRSDEILGLRILDPAMGSGAFLVAACRYLAAAVEDALVREGKWHPHDVTRADRAMVRREVASRCLFGVDVNPMAVQLARLAIWLGSLASDKPLSFLDHHLVAGNSLIGATPDDLRRQPSGGSGRSRRQEALPLFQQDGLSDVFEHAVRVRLDLTSQPDDSPAIIREKERTLARLQRHSSLGAWSRALDLWCAGWFWDSGTAPDRGTFRELVAYVLEGRSSLPDRICSSLLANAERVSTRYRFHHWPVVFPEVFVDQRGAPLSNPGFDAVVGNPPWDMVRGDSGDDEMRGERKRNARQLTDFVRESGIYRVESRAHANLYQLFVERTLQLVRLGGRIGLVLPSGVVSDAGAAPLRRHVFDNAQVDEITGLDNRDAIFPIHRSTRFVLLTCTSGLPTHVFRCRFGVSRADDLQRIDTDTGKTVLLTRAFLTRLSGEEDLGVPELTGGRDLSLLERITATVPRLGGDDGWGLHFSRELNASDDRDAFIDFSGAGDSRPIVEGKHIDPFRVSLDRCRLQLDPRAEPRLKVPRRARLAYRDVASATNRLTLIAAIIPARAVTTHTLFCLKTILPLGEQHVLCALFNSFVANYLIRFRVNTHVTVTLTSRLPVPVVKDGHPLYERLRRLSDTITRATTPVEEMPEYAELQALVARLYGLTAGDFEHVLSTFPLILAETKRAALAAFKDIH